MKRTVLLAISVGELRDSSYEVVVDDSSGEYARTFAGDVDRALHLAVPYIATVALSMLDLKELQ